MADQQMQSTQQRPQIKPQQGKETVQGTSEVKVQPERGITRRTEPLGLAQRGAAGWPVSPFSMMRRMMGDMDRLFEDFGLGRTSRELWPLAELSSLRSSFVPEVELFERNGKLVVCADLPGIKKEDIRVSCDEQGLLIEGERKSTRQEQREGYYHSERSYGSFSRRIPIPQGVEVETCAASFDDGVLEIELDLSKEGRRQIEVRSRGEIPKDKASTVEVGKDVQH